MILLHAFPTASPRSRNLNPALLDRSDVVASDYPESGKDSALAARLRDPGYKGVVERITELDRLSK